MSKPIDIAIVGLNFGRHVVDYLVETEASDLFRIAVVCDQNRERADAIAAKIGARASYDLEEVLADPSVPAIGLFTGPTGRAELIRRCLRASKHVMTTKPFENDPAAALAVLQEAREMGKVVHLNSPAPLLPADLGQIAAWREEFGLGRPIACRADVWCSYNEQEDGTWYDDPALCPVAPVFRLGIYLINDLVRLVGPAERVQVMHSRICGGRPTPDNAQLGIQFQDGTIANIFASFCVNDGDHYRNSLTLNFENGTIYRNVGAQRSEGHQGHCSELALVMNQAEGRAIVAQAAVSGGSGGYQWDAFHRSILGEALANAVTDEQVVHGLLVVEAMAKADSGSGVARVRGIDEL